MAGEQDVAGIALGLSLDTSGWSSGIARAKAELDGLKGAASDIQIGVGVRGGGRGAGSIVAGGGGSIAAGSPGGLSATVSPRFQVSAASVRALKVEINSAFRQLSSGGEAVSVPVKLGRVPFAAMRQELEAGIGTLTIKNVALSTNAVNSLSRTISTSAGVSTGAAVEIVQTSAKRSGLKRRAAGGPVNPNHPYLVGEDGPEIMWPRSSGHIQPSRSMREQMLERRNREIQRQLSRERQTYPKAMRGRGVSGYGGKYGSVKPLRIDPNRDQASGEQGYAHHMTYALDAIRGRKKGSTPGVAPQSPNWAAGSGNESHTPPVRTWDPNWRGTNQGRVSFWADDPARTKNYGYNQIRTPRTKNFSDPFSFGPGDDPQYRITGRRVPRRDLQYWGQDNDWHKFRRGRTRSEGGEAHRSLGGLIRGILPAEQVMKDTFGAGSIQYTRNLRAKAAQLEPRHIEGGKAWYAEAQGWIRDTAKAYNKPEHVVRGMTAALSAGTAWDANKTKVIRILNADRDGKPFPYDIQGKLNPWGSGIVNATGLSSIDAQYRLGIRKRPLDAHVKAYKMLHTGIDPWELLGHTPKTGNFFKNLGGNLKAVTIDRWALRSATRGAIDKISKGTHRTKIEKSFFKVARENGMEPAEHQAAIWLLEKEQAEMAEYTQKMKVWEARGRKGKEPMAPDIAKMGGNYQPVAADEKPHFLGGLVRRARGGLARLRGGYCSTCRTGTTRNHYSTAKHQANVRGLSQGTGSWMKSMPGGHDRALRQWDHQYDEEEAQHRTSYPQMGVRPDEALARGGAAMKGAGYVPGLRALAQGYNKMVGLPRMQEQILHPLDADFSRRTAKAYEQMPVGPDELSRKAYKAFGEETDAQYDYFQKAGYKFDADLGDPYTPRPGQRRTKMQLAADDVRKNKRLLAFGSALEHPLLTNEQNLKFRHVHDMMGHLTEGFSIGPRGEYNAAVKHSQMFTPLAQMAMLAETHGQNSVVNFSEEKVPGHGGKTIAEVNKAAPGTIYAQQKAQVLPAHILEEFYERTGQRRRSRGGDVKALEGMFPNARVVLDRFSNKDIKSIREAAEPLAKRYPLTADNLRAVAFNPTTERATNNTIIAHTMASPFDLAEGGHDRGATYGTRILYQNRAARIGKGLRKTLKESLVDSSTAGMFRHEFGHAVDMTHGTSPRYGASEFDMKMVSKYAQGGLNESFAETFAGNESGHQIPGFGDFREKLDQISKLEHAAMSKPQIRASWRRGRPEQFAMGGEVQGRYVVNEIGRELFVPKSHEGIIPPDVAAQIPGMGGLAARLAARQQPAEPWKPAWMRRGLGKDLTGRARGGLVPGMDHSRPFDAERSMHDDSVQMFRDRWAKGVHEIGGPAGPREWDAPEDGWIIPARLKSKVPRKLGGPVKPRFTKGADGKTYFFDSYGRPLKRENYEAEREAFAQQAMTENQANVASATNGPFAPTEIGKQVRKERATKRQRGVLADIDVDLDPIEDSVHDEGRRRLAAPDSRGAQARARSAANNARTGRSALGGIAGFLLGGGQERQAHLAAARSYRVDYQNALPKGFEKGTDTLEAFTHQLHKLDELEGRVTHNREKRAITETQAERQKDRIASTRLGVEEKQKNAQKLQVLETSELGKATGGAARNFAAVTAAGLAFNIGMEGVSKAIGYAVEAAAPVADRLSGYTATNQRVSKGLAEQLPGAGTLGTLFGKTAFDAGISGRGADVFQAGLGGGVLAKAGATKAGSAGDLIKALYGTGAPDGLVGGYGGVGGSSFLGSQLGGGKGLLEEISGQVSVTRGGAEGPQSEGDRKVGAGIGAAGRLFTNAFKGLNNLLGTGSDPGYKTQDITQEVISQTPDQLKARAESLNTYNEATQRAQTATGAQGGATLVEDAEAAKAVAEATSGAKDEASRYANAMAQVGVVFKDVGGKALSSADDLKKATSVIAQGLAIPDQGAFAKQEAQGLVASRQLEAAHRAFETNVQIPGQLGAQLAANPLSPAGTGFDRSNPGGVSQAQINAIQKGQDDLTRQGQAGIAGNIAHITTNLGAADAAQYQRLMTGTGQQGGLPSTGGNVQAGVESVQSLGQAIEAINTALSNKQAAINGMAYAQSLVQINRAMGIALAMAGRGGSKLGKLEARQYSLGRQSEGLGLQSANLGLQSQGLSLAMNQRQINFQTAIAGFQAPGITGQERAARMAEAELEASYAQKQQNISVKQYGISGQQQGIAGEQYNLSGAIHQEEVKNSLADLEAQKAILTQTHELEQQQIAAQKQIATDTAKQAQLMAKANAILNGATGNFESELGSAAKFLAMFGGTVEGALIAVRRGIEVLTTGSTKPGTTSGKAGGDTTTGGSSNVTHNGVNAAGYDGSVLGATSFTAGEAGGEHVVVLRNPRHGTMGPGSTGSSNTNTIQIQITGNQITSDTNLDELASKVARAVEDRLGQKAAMLGTRVA